MVPGNHDRYHPDTWDSNITHLGKLRVLSSRAIRHAYDLWPGEVTDNMARCLADDIRLYMPDIVATHGPGEVFGNPYDSPIHRAIPHITLAMESVGTRWHLHGHCHNTGGSVHRTDTVITVNAAEHVCLIDTETEEVEVRKFSEY